MSLTQLPGTLAGLSSAPLGQSGSNPGWQAASLSSAVSGAIAPTNASNVATYSGDNNNRLIDVTPIGASIITVL